MQLGFWFSINQHLYGQDVSGHFKAGSPELMIPAVSDYIYLYDLLQIELMQ